LRSLNTLLKCKYKLKFTVLQCCSTFPNHSRVFNNEQHSYPKMSVKRPLACSWVVLFMCEMAPSLQLRGTLYVWNGP
jgi:hypothetical protein